MDAALIAALLAVGAVIGVAAGLLGCIERQVLRQERPWTDETHVALENIEEFRQFIQTDGTQPQAKMCEPFVIRQDMAVFIVCSGDHRAKFVHLKDTPILTSTRLSKKYRPGALQPDGYRDQSHQRECYWQ